MNPSTKHALIACLVLTTLTQLTTLFFNGVLNAVQSTVTDSARDWATCVQAVEMLVLALVARHKPRVIAARALCVAAAACSVGGTALCAWGVGMSSGLALNVGTCLTSSTIAWATVTWLLLCSTLAFRYMLACFALGGLAAIPLYLALSPLGYSVCLVLYALASLTTVICCTFLMRTTFTQFTEAEPAADVEVTNPHAVLPFTHDLFVYICAFCLAYGFALRFEAEGASVMCNWFAAALLMGMAAYAFACQKAPRADVVFSTAFILLFGGFLLVLIDDGRTATTASIVLVGSKTVFSLLLSVALCTIAGRNRSNAIPTLAWGYAVYYCSIETGAQLGMLVTSMASQDHLIAQGIVAFLLAAVTFYTMFSMRDFGFDKTIASVDDGVPVVMWDGRSAPETEPVVEVQVQFADPVEARCDELAGRFGLTERETDVFRLLVRGNNTLRIQEELSITKNTLKYHARHIYEKSGVHSQQELIDLL